MTTRALFENIPKEDFLGLFPGDRTDFQKVVKLLDFGKNDVARASNVSVHSVRYDPPKMPKELQDRLIEWAVALNLVAQFFKDEHKTVLWFKTPNPLLGDMTPRDMIRVGRFRKLRRFIQNALSENEPQK
jgi:antitoxin Xre/MbcA/ParS-like protein